MRLSKSVLTVGGVVLAGILFTVMNPTTVHALAAALVQVTNTASNPVVTESVNHQAAQMIELTCNMTVVEPRGGNGQCFLLSPTTGNAGVPYVVPANQSLIITAVDIVSDNFRNFCVPGEVYGENLQVAGTGIVPYSRSWDLSFIGTSRFGPTNHFSYPSGLVFAPNSTLIPEEDSGCAANFELTGYLTNN